MPETWEQVKEIVGSALELDPAQRLEFVRARCGDNPALREEVESLLANQGIADSVLENPPASSLHLLGEVNLAGRRIGAYRITREIGRGGMAVVYLAARDDREFVRQVAIKMVKASVNNQEVLRRFRNERQTLAALDHPNIVKLLDGGTTEEGWPYLVMEFVEGAPIDQYCDSHHLSVAERLKLFQIVCSAVQYAHSHQVIHRDLKPSNILITAEGIPRLLDFGIAKVLSPELLPDQTSTVGEWRPMTPEFASPEQIRGRAITPASDVYSLGVLLYGLLSGSQPYPSAFSSWVEVERAVCEQIPLEPSSAVRRGKSSSSAPAEPATSAIAENRGTGMDNLMRCLRGDLDNIVLMALRKEPQRRYQSADELSQDIERYRSRLPVKARQPTFSYRSRKFLRRHQEAAIVLAFALLVLAVAIGWQLPRLWRRAPAEAPPALVRERPSVAVLGFKNLAGQRESTWLSTALSEMLTTELGAGEGLRIVPGETVSRAKIDLRLPDEDTFSPETLQLIRSNLRTQYVVAGSFLESASGDLRVDLRLQDTSRGETIFAMSETGTLTELGKLVSNSGARLRSKLGISAASQFEASGVEASFPSNPEAMKEYSEGLARLRSFDALGARDFFMRAIKADPDFPLAHTALAGAFQVLGYDARAAEESKKALDLAERLPRQDYLQVEAHYYEASRNWDKAIETYRALFSFFPDNLEYGLSLARAQTSAGKGKEALVTLDELEKSNKRNREDPRIDLARSEAASSFGDNRLRRDAGESAAHKASQDGARLLVARARTSECRALANLGENERTGPVCEEARRIYTEAGDRGGLARALHYTAEVPLNQDNLPAAEKLYREALTLTREIGDRQGIGRELGNLALIYKYRGDFATALSMMKEALQNQEEAGDKNGMAIQSGNIGNLLRLQGDLRGALQYYERALALSNEVGHRSSVALAMVSIGEVLMLRGDLTTAGKNFQQALAIHRELGEKFYYAAALQSIGSLYRLQGELDKARSSYKEALSVQEQIAAQGGAAETRLLLAELDCDAGKLAASEAGLRAVVPVFQSLKEFNDEIAAQGLLSEVLAFEGKTGEARETASAATQLAEKSNNAIVRMSLSLNRAYMLAAAGSFAQAAKTAREVLKQAQDLGIPRLEMEASLAEAEALAKNDPAAAPRLKEVERACTKTGFRLFALKASKRL